MCALLRAGKHQVDIRVAIGDESLHTVQTPRAVLVLCGLEHDALQIATSVGLREVHGHRGSLADAGDVLLSLLLRSKLIERVDAALQAPNVLETRIGRRDDLGEHGEDHIGEVQATVLTRHGDTPQARLAGSVDILDRLARIDHASIDEVRTFQIDRLTVRLDDVGGHVARNVQHALIVLYRIFVADGSVGKLILVSIALLLQLHDALHQRVIEVELNLRMVGIVICHNMNSLPPGP